MKYSVVAAFVGAALAVVAKLIAAGIYVACRHQVANFAETISAAFGLAAMDLAVDVPVGAAVGVLLGWGARVLGASMSAITGVVVAAVIGAAVEWLRDGNQPHINPVLAVGLVGALWGVLALMAVGSVAAVRRRA